ncbi:nucleoside deaminase [candidate division KSB1 bacterium]|nr:nucleoside deaminase [candidate division KSB1 bacterium]
MDEHEKWMTVALREAEKAYDKDEIPVGSVIVYEGKAIAKGYNLVESLQDPTAHAEMLSITAAANHLASWRLTDTILYTTLEPCPMCAGAILMARIPIVVFGASDPRFGACGSVENILQNPAWYSDIAIYKNVLLQPCSTILKSFFEKIRNKSI